MRRMGTAVIAASLLAACGVGVVEPAGSVGQATQNASSLSTNTNQIGASGQVQSNGLFVLAHYNPSDGNFYYVSAQDGGDYRPPVGNGVGKVTVDRTSAGSWETFTLVHSPLYCGPVPADHCVAIQTLNKGLYLSAQKGGGGAVQANRQVIGSWETYVIEDNGDGTVNFRTWNGYYLSAIQNGGPGTLLDAHATSARQWEAFYMWNASSPYPPISGRLEVTEPDWLVYDVLLNDPENPTAAQVTFPVHAHFNFTVQNGVLTQIGDYLGLECPGPSCVWAGEFSNANTYNWDEITDNSGFDRKFDPYAELIGATWYSHLTPGSWESGCFKQGGDWNEDCWEHTNANGVAPINNFPTTITHHEVVTYLLDFTCRWTIRDCQYQILDPNFDIAWLGCVDLPPQMGPNNPRDPSAADACSPAWW